MGSLQNAPGNSGETVSSRRRQSKAQPSGERINEFRRLKQRASPLEFCVRVQPSWCVGLGAYVVPIGERERAI